MKDGVCGVNLGDEVGLQEVTILDVVLAVGDIERHIRCAKFLELDGGELECTAGGADVIHNENLFPSEVNVRDHIQSENFSGLPVSLLDAKGDRKSTLLDCLKVYISLTSALIRKEDDIWYILINTGQYIQIGRTVTDIVDERLADIGVDIVHRHFIQFKRVDEVSKHLEREVLIRILDSVHPGIGDIRHKQTDFSVLPISPANPIHSTGKGEQFLIGVITPLNLDRIRFMYYNIGKLDTLGTVREVIHFHFCIIDCNHKSCFLI
jgi:hypothetical protein